MKKLIVFFCMSHFLFSTLFGQDAEKFNEIYKKTYIEISQQDYKKALVIGDSLFKT